MSRHVITIGESDSCQEAVARMHRARARAPVVTVTLDEDLSAAAGMMLKEKLGSLPVVGDERVIGIVTETDLLRQICRAAACSPEVADIVVSYP